MSDQQSIGEVAERIVSRGRPTSYLPGHAAEARKLAHLGATDVEIADFFDVAISTVSLWKITHDDFSEALKAGKEAFDARVERSLAHRAVGYTFDAVKIFPPKDKDDPPLLVPYREHVPPDTTACIFWLKNRKPAEWRDRVEMTHKNGDLDRLSDQELYGQLAQQAKDLGVNITLTYEPREDEKD